MIIYFIVGFVLGMLFGLGVGVAWALSAWSEYEATKQQDE